MAATSPARAVLLLAALIAAGLFAWQLSHVALLVFAAILFATILRSAASLFERLTPLKPPLSLAPAGLLLLAAAAGFITILGAQIRAQFDDLAGEIPGMLDALGESLGADDIENQIGGWLENAGENGLAGMIANYTFGAFDVLTTLVIVIVAGIYLAVHPATYLKGALQLIPASARDRVARGLSFSGHALRRWLLGQLCSMAIVGILTTLGLYLIGMPSPLALGFLAGLAEFVPLVGPLAAAIPAVLLALAEGDGMVIWVVVLYIAIQQLDGNVILPLIQRRAVRLPPALMLVAILAAGALFGPLGVILAVPMAVVAYVLVKQLYVRDVLGEETPIPGQEDDPGARKPTEQADPPSVRQP